MLIFGGPEIAENDIFLTRKVRKNTLTKVTGILAM
jgi:hypothetical protein